MDYSYPGSFYSPTFIPPDPQHIESRELRRSATFVGILMLVLTATMQFAYPIVALILTMSGFLPQNALLQSDLGVGNTAFLLIYSVVYALAMGSPLLLTLFFRKQFSQKFKKKPLTFGVNFGAVLFAVGGCMGANIVTSYLLTILEQWGIPVPESPDMLEPTWISLILNIFVIGILPAVLEEAVFRGCVLRVLRPYGDGFAVVISAILFGLMHGNIRQIPFATLVGLILGWLYVTTNSIFWPMLIHFINNALSVIMEYCAFGMSDQGVSVFYGGIIYGLAAVGAMSALLVLLIRGSQLRIERRDTSLRTGGKVAALFRSPVFIISLIVFIGLTGLELML